MDKTEEITQLISNLDSEELNLVIEYIYTLTLQKEFKIDLDQALNEVNQNKTSDDFDSFEEMMRSINE
ncbi:hypothetical protein IHP33_12000 [Enterococcus faecalis]|uniref:hypothetical protein n=1 Tax=Enterococcus TaxID=1350 RepID=UPI0013EB2710|nr:MULTISPECIES: hypothetical protein [Enterococcus]EME3580356.1 hypothetical protein [Enterococcus faecium]MBD9846442.1 hypothetical protein [Enterococcus faecalis]